MKTVIEMAREARLCADGPTLEALERFAALVREDERRLQHPMNYDQGFTDGYEAGLNDEREACANVCDDYGAFTTRQVAAVIRARSNDV